MDNVERPREVEDVVEAMGGFAERVTRSDLSGDDWMEEARRIINSTPSLRANRSTREYANPGVRVTSVTREGAETWQRLRMPNDRDGFTWGNAVGYVGETTENVAAVPPGRAFTTSTTTVRARRGEQQNIPMSTLVAHGLMIHTVLTHAIGAMDRGCCIRCCAMCAAVAHLKSSTEGQLFAKDALRAAGYTNSNTNYMRMSGRIRWAELAASWEGYQCANFYHVPIVTESDVINGHPQWQTIAANRMTRTMALLDAEDPF
jgi:hypothetical protein